MVFDSKTVKRINIGLSLKVFHYFVLRPMKSGQDNIAKGRLLSIKATLELKGNTFVETILCISCAFVVFPGKVKDYSLPKLFLSVRVFM